MARRMRAVIHSNKHYVPRVISTAASGGIVNETIAVAVIAPASANATQVVEGSNVKAVFVETWLAGAGTAGQQSAFNITLEKRMGGQPAMTNAQSLALDAYPNKKNILYTTQGIISSDLVGPTTPIIRQWFAIPKGKQRMGLGDTIVLNLSAIAAIDFQFCGQYTYKEYR